MAPRYHSPTGPVGGLVFVRWNPFWRLRGIAWNASQYRLNEETMTRPTRLLRLTLVLLATVLLGMLAPAPQVHANALPAPLADGPDLTAKVTGNVVNLRTGPSTGYTVIGRTTEGKTLAVTGKNDGGSWLQVSVSAKTAWISGQYVQPSGSIDALPVVKVAPPPKAAAGAPAPSRAAGFFGYGAQIDPWADRGRAIGALKDLQFEWVKFQLRWTDFEGGGPGQRNWPDDVINDLSGNGLKILASVVNAPAWARPAGADLGVGGPPADHWTYASFVGEFAGRYCGRVNAIEVWNEQNMHYEWGNEKLDAARYVRLLEASYRSIKAACPSTIVVSGAPTPTGAPPPVAVRDTTYLEQMYRAGLRRWSDAIGVHPSGFGNPPDARVQDWQAGNYSRPSHVSDSSFYFRNTMEQYRNIMVKYGDGNKRLWPTEFGWASTGSPAPGYEYAAYNNEQQQGEYIARAYQIMKGWGWVGVAFLWNLNFNTSVPAHDEKWAFGILGRPAYDIVKNMQR